MIGSNRHLQLGALGEDAAASFVRRLGWNILARNWRPTGLSRSLELDMVARDGGTIVFVEVKCRQVPCAVAKSGQATGRKLKVPTHAAFTSRKQERIARAANIFLSEHAFWNLPCRFDLICVEHEQSGHLTLEHHINVIEFGHIVDRGNAAWQPW